MNEKEESKKERIFNIFTKKNERENLTMNWKWEISEANSAINRRNNRQVIDQENKKASEKRKQTS